MSQAPSSFPVRKMVETRPAIDKTLSQLAGVLSSGVQAATAVVRTDTQKNLIDNRVAQGKADAENAKRGLQVQQLTAEATVTDNERKLLDTQIKETNKTLAQMSSVEATDIANRTELGLPQRDDAVFEKNKYNQRMGIGAHRAAETMRLGNEHPQSYGRFITENEQFADFNESITEFADFIDIKDPVQKMGFLSAISSIHKELLSQAFHTKKAETVRESMSGAEILASTRSKEFQDTAFSFGTGNPILDESNYAMASSLWLSQTTDTAKTLHEQATELTLSGPEAVGVFINNLIDNDRERLFNRIVPHLESAMASGDTDSIARVFRQISRHESTWNKLLGRKVFMRNRTAQEGAMSKNKTASSAVREEVATHYIGGLTNDTAVMKGVNTLVSLIDSDSPEGVEARNDIRRLGENQLAAIRKTRIGVVDTEVKLLQDSLEKTGRGTDLLELKRTIVAAQNETSIDLDGNAAPLMSDLQATNHLNNAYSTVQSQSLKQINTATDQASLDIAVEKATKLLNDPNVVNPETFSGEIIQGVESAKKNSLKFDKWNTAASRTSFDVIPRDEHDKFTEWNLGELPNDTAKLRFAQDWYRQKQSLTAPLAGVLKAAVTLPNTGLNDTERSLQEAKRDGALATLGMMAATDDPKTLNALDALVGQQAVVAAQMRNNGRSPADYAAVAQLSESEFARVDGNIRSGFSNSVLDGLLDDSFDTLGSTEIVTPADRLAVQRIAMADLSSNSEYMRLVGVDLSKADEEVVDDLRAVETSAISRAVAQYVDQSATVTVGTGEMFVLDDFIMLVPKEMMLNGERVVNGAAADGGVIMDRQTDALGIFGANIDAGNRREQQIDGVKFITIPTTARGTTSEIIMPTEDQAISLNKVLDAGDYNGNSDGLIQAFVDQVNKDRANQ